MPTPALLVAQASEAGPSLQPFECLVCNRRFTRHENLKRHAILHKSVNTTIKCPYCVSTFSRRDLRRRHVKRKHPLENDLEDGEDQEEGVVGTSQEGVENTDIETGGKSVDLPHGASAVIPFNEALTLGGSNNAPISPLKFDFGTDNSWSPVDFDYLLQDTTSAGAGTGTGTGTSTAGVRVALSNTSLSPPIPLPFLPIVTDSNDNHTVPFSTISLGQKLFFDKTSHYLNFLHQPTLDVSQIPKPLVLAIAAVGLQFAESSSDRARASECYYQGKSLLADEAAWKDDLSCSSRTLGIIQALLLLATHAILYIGDEETQYGFRLHSKCVELARRGGLMEPYPIQQADTSNLGQLWANAIRVESHKRTLFAIYMHDAIWYCLLSRPRSLSHLEIKHELPMMDDLWVTTTVEAWAHKTLSSPTQSKPPRYIDTVRASLSSDGIPATVAISPWSTLMVVMFHYTSIREVSGWSTMTGRTSFDRFEALHTSLSAMEPLCTRSRANRNDTTISLACIATWHICMIEMFLWSQPHTGGLVEGSLDAALAAATTLIATYPVRITPDIADSLEIHLTWMITYLHQTVDIVSEPPWMTAYLFKAALVALQIVGIGIHKSLACTGVTTTSQMLDWMRGVFKRRTMWAIGRLIVKSLQELDGMI